MTRPVFFLPAMLRPNSINGMGRFGQQIRVTKLHRILHFEKKLDAPLKKSVSLPQVYPFRHLPNSLVKERKLPPWLL